MEGNARRIIRGDKFSYNESLDDNLLETSNENYIYRFKSDSTFERGKLNYKHGDVEEAHGRVSISKDKKVMKWYLHWDNQERIDTTDIQIIAITPIKIVINESNGAHSILQILERIDSDSAPYLAVAVKFKFDYGDWCVISPC